MSCCKIIKLYAEMLYFFIIPIRHQNLNHRVKGLLLNMKLIYFEPNTAMLVVYFYDINYWYPFSCHRRDNA